MLCVVCCVLYFVVQNGNKLLTILWCLIGYTRTHILVTHEVAAISAHLLSTPRTSLQCHFVQSQIHRVHVGISALLAE